MSRRNSNLVNPQLRRLVGMDVVHPGCEANDQPILDGDCDVMTSIFKEFFGQFRIDWIVEHPRGNSPEDSIIAAPQDLDFDG